MLILYKKKISYLNFTQCAGTAPPIIEFYASKDESLIKEFYDNARLHGDYSYSLIDAEKIKDNIDYTRNKTLVVRVYFTVDLKYARLINGYINIVKDDQDGKFDKELFYYDKYNNTHFARIGLTSTPNITEFKWTAMLERLHCMMMQQISKIIHTNKEFLNKILSLETYYNINEYNNNEPDDNKDIQDDINHNT